MLTNVFNNSNRRLQNCLHKYIYYITFFLHKTIKTIDYFEYCGVDVGNYLNIQNVAIDLWLFIF
jgi:hypothetical protein